MKQKQQFIQDLRHYRHDWLNHIQIIKGYLALGKEEDLRKFLDQIMLQAYSDTDISEIGDANLAYYLLTYNWRQNKLKLEVEVRGESRHLAQIGNRYPFLYEWVEKITHHLEAISISEQQNHLLLELQVEETSVNLGVDLEGEWQPGIETEVISRLSQEIERQAGILTERNIDEGQIAFDIQINA